MPGAPGALTTVMPDVIDALVSRLRTRFETALPEVRVDDGQVVTDDPGDFLTIGGRIDLTDPTASARAAQEWAHAGAQSRDEEGSVTCAALSWRGHDDVKAARDALFDIVAEVELELRADYTLGVPGLLWTSFGTDFDLVQMQDDAGVYAQVSFSIAYRARLTRGA